MSAADSPTALTDRTLKGLLWSFAGAGTQVVVQIIVLMVLARLLTPTEFGLVGAAMIVIGFSQIFSELGVGPAIVQRPTLEAGHIHTGLTLSLLLGSLFFLMTFLTAPLAALFFDMDALAQIIRGLSVLFLVRGIGVVAHALLQREMRFRELALVEVVSFAAGYGLVGIALAWHGLGVWALVGAQLAQTSVSTAGHLVAKRHSFRLMLRRRAVRDLLWFGAGFSGGRIGAYAASQGDNLVIGRLMGAEALGLYGRAYQFMVMPAQLLGKVLESVLFPVMATVQHQPKRIANAFRRSTLVVGLLTIPLSVIIVLVGGEIVRTFLGSGWDGAILPLQILALGLFARTSYKLSSPLTKAMGAVYRRAWRLWLYAGMVVGGASLGTLIGLPGVAIGVLGAVLAYHAMMIHLSLSLIGMKWREYVRAHYPGALLGLVAGATGSGVAALTRLLEMSDAVILLSTCAISSIVTIAVMLAAMKASLFTDAPWLRTTVYRQCSPRLRENRWVSYVLG